MPPPATDPPRSCRPSAPPCRPEHRGARPFGPAIGRPMPGSCHPHGSSYPVLCRSARRRVCNHLGGQQRSASHADRHTVPAVATFPGSTRASRRSSPGSPTAATRWSAFAAGGPGLLETNPDDEASVAANVMPLSPTAVRTIDRTGGTVLHTSRTNPGRVKTGTVPAFLADQAVGDGPYDLTKHTLRVIEHLGLDALIPIGGDDTLVLRPAAARRRRPGHRDPEDDGQRRPRHRLLHRLLDGGHAGRRVHPCAAHVDRVA